MASCGSSLRTAASKTLTTDSDPGQGKHSTLKTFTFTFDYCFTSTCVNKHFLSRGEVDLLDMICTDYSTPEMEAEGCANFRIGIQTGTMISTFIITAKYMK